MQKLQLDGPVTSSKIGCIDEEESLQYVFIHSQLGGIIGILCPGLPRPIPPLRLVDTLPLLL